jgi:hypothetical protein
MYAEVLMFILCILGDRFMQTFGRRIKEDNECQCLVHCLALVVAEKEESQNVSEGNY